MRYTVDRIEGDFAVCETEGREMVDIPLASLPFEAREGASFERIDGEYRLVDIEQKRQEIRGLMETLFKKRRRRQ